MLEIPRIILRESSLPLTGDKYYLITESERKSLAEFVSAADAVPETEWRKWSTDVALMYSAAANTAYEILRQSVIKKE